jgi:hypothetical protein
VERRRAARTLNGPRKGGLSLHHLIRHHFPLVVHTHLPE